MLGSRSGSLLIWSRAYSMASIRWIPFSFLISPQGTPTGPRECTGNSPPSLMSPSILMEWGWVPCWAHEPGPRPARSTHSSRGHAFNLHPDGVLGWDEWACDVMVMVSRGTYRTRLLPLPLAPGDSPRSGVTGLIIVSCQNLSSEMRSFYHFEMFPTPCSLSSPQRKQYLQPALCLKLLLLHYFPYKGGKFLNVDRTLLQISVVLAQPCKPRVYFCALAQSWEHKMNIKDKKWSSCGLREYFGQNLG